LFKLFIHFQSLFLSTRKETRARILSLHLKKRIVKALKPQSNGPSYSNTMAVDGWVVTFGTARRGLGGAAACPGPSSLY